MHRLPSFTRPLVLFVVALCTPGLLAQQADDATTDDNESAELTLERLFPEEGLFGPSARGVSLSADGRYAAYLYRTFDERRHGNDLWIYDFEEKTTTRVTSLALMTEFQRSARVVAADRLSKAGKGSDKDDADDAEAEGTEEDDAEAESGEDKDEQGEDDAQEKDDEIDEQERRERINTVGPKDAEDDYGPRYSGISGFVWHPDEPTLLLFSEGDIYRIADVAEPVLERLTNTTLRETQVDYLPDGSGYSFQVQNSICRLRFDDHRIDQLNPRMPDGMQLSRHTISPDGKKLAIVARREADGASPRSRQVDIIRYRDRFAKADSVPRTVPDDEVTAEDVYVFLYDLSGTESEQSNLLQVFHERVDEPRDIISTPHWSLDSDKVTFCFFNQEDDEVQIRVAQFPDGETLSELVEKAEKAAVRERRKKEREAREEEEEQGYRSSVDIPDIDVPLTVEFDADIVYRFKHDGGPNTPRMVSPDWATDSRHVTFVSEQSGFRHVHRLDTLYQSVKQLTEGRYEVYPFRFSEDHQTLFATATKDDSARDMVYAIDTETGEMRKLSARDGSYSSVDVSDDGTRLIANFVTYGELPALIAQHDDAVETIASSHSSEAAELIQWMPEFFSYENRHGHEIHGLVHKPEGWSEDAEEPYPLLIYVYGGPLGTRKSVVDGSYQSSGYFFAAYMAEKHGYVSVVIDPRGQSGYGGLFEKANFGQVGKPQVEDLVDGVQYLIDEMHVDASRVAIHGWSFGGFQTQMCLYTEPTVFQVGMAGAGPTEWENYNAWYTTGTVGPSSEDEGSEQDGYSLLPLAKNLEGQLLLVHGMEDTNVLFQDTVAIYRELLRAGKETHVELFLDPTGGHGLGGDIKLLNRMKKYEEFLLRTIGRGGNVEADESDD